MLSREHVSEILLRIDAVSISLTNPFRYASGMQSPIYINCRTLSSHPNERNEIVKYMGDVANNLGEEIDLVVGTSLSSIAIASLLARHLQLPMAYVRSKQKSHGQKKEIEGNFKEGDRVLLISDIVSTEKELPNAVEIIQKNGGIVVHCLSVFSNNIGIVEDFLKGCEISHSVLTDLPTLLKVAYKKGFLSHEEKVAIKEWCEDRDKWFENRPARVEEALKDIKTSVAKILLEVGAVQINEKQPFQYASGLLGPIYTDNRLLMAHPHKWEVVIDSFVYVITNVIGVQNFDVIAGIATSGIPHATLIAERLGLPMVYIELEGDKKHIEGKIKKGDRVLLIEDHISTGGSVLSSAHVLKDAGIITEWCLAIFTYGFQESKLRFTNENVNLITLSDLSTLTSVATEMKYIGLEEKDSILAWSNNPELWASE